MASEADGASAAFSVKIVSAVAAGGISGAAGKGAAASVSATSEERSSSLNSTSRPCRAAKAARNATRASSEENWSVPVSITVTCESIRSQIRPSLPISRNRQAISRSTRAPLRTGASRCSSARLSSASTADSSAASTELRMAASASVRRSCAAVAAATASAACCAERPSSCWRLASRSRVSSRWAVRLCSIRATASSTMRVSALRLRLAYSVRNQRPREVSMKASAIAA